jgi:hypothetical protein
MAANRQAAELILRDVLKYGGEQAALVQWARFLLRKLEPSVSGPLFRGRR